MARKKKLPTGVQPHGSGYRARISVGGTRVPGPVRQTPEEAAQDYKRMQKPRAVFRATLGDALDLLIDDARTNLSDGSVRYYESQKAQLLRAFNASVPLHSISQRDIQDFIRIRRKQKHIKRGKKAPTKDIGPETVRKNLRTILRVYRLAARRGWCNASDCPVEHADITRIRTSPRKPDWFSKAEVEGLVGQIRAADDAGAARDADIIQMLFLTGLRRAEAARLAIDDVDLRGMALRVQGKRGGRMVPLSSEAAKVLARLSLQASDRLFPGGVEEIKRACQRWQRRLPEPRLHPHALRHSTGSELARHHSPAVVAAILGHSVSMTMRYFHLSGADAVHAISSLNPGTPREGRSDTAPPPPSSWTRSSPPTPSDRPANDLAEQESETRSRPDDAGAANFSA